MKSWNIWRLWAYIPRWQRAEAGRWVPSSPKPSSHGVLQHGTWLGACRHVNSAACPLLPSVPPTVSLPTHSAPLLCYSSSLALRSTSNTASSGKRSRWNTALFLTLHNTLHNPYHMGSAVPVSHSHWIAGSAALDFSWFLASTPLPSLRLSRGAVSSWSRPCPAPHRGASLPTLFPLRDLPVYSGGALFCLALSRPWLGRWARACQHLPGCARWPNAEVQC